MRNLLRILYFFNFKTLYFNFKYLPFKQAIKFPFFISRKTNLIKTKGEVIIVGTVYTGMIRIGFADVGIFDKKYLRAIWEVSGIVIFYGKALIKFGAKISVGDSAKLSIGNNFRISSNSSVVCFKEIVFGDDNRISWDTIIIDTDFHNISLLDGTIINEPRKIKTGNRVWIGMRCSVLKGVEIEDDNVIASNTLVNKTLVGSNSIFAGIPARVIKTGIKWF